MLTPDRDFIVRTLVDLVRINSVNPSIAPDGAGEAEIAAYVARTLAALGLETRDLRAAAGANDGGGHAARDGRRPVADAQRARRHGGRRRDGGPVLRRDPRWPALRPRRARHEGEPGGVHRRREDAGRRRRAPARRPRRGRRGRRRVREPGHRRPHHARQVDAAIVTEPTNLEVCLAHKGYIWIDVETEARPRTAVGSPRASTR